MKLIYNPITRRAIQNTKRNRESIVNQINKYIQQRRQGNDLVLISCSKQKSFAEDDETIVAGNAYCSNLFRKSKDWADNRSMDWAILSARYGLLNPNQPITDYDLTLNELSPKQRKQWADNVAKQMMMRPKPEKVYLLAGSNYSRDLKPILESNGLEVEEPLRGMQIGERLSELTMDNTWMNWHNRSD